MSSQPVFIGVRVARSFVLCVVFCRSLFVLMFLFFDLRILIWLSLIWSNSSFINTTFCHQYIFSSYIIACSRGTYGLNCSETCSNCKYQSCSSVTGVCRAGCNGGWKGDKCNQGIRFCILYINVIFSIQDKKNKERKANFKATHG